MEYTKTFEINIIDQETHYSYISIILAAELLQNLLDGLAPYYNYTGRESKFGCLLH